MNKSLDINSFKELVILDGVIYIDSKRYPHNSLIITDDSYSLDIFKFIKNLSIFKNQIPIILDKKGSIFMLSQKGKEFKIYGNINHLILFSARDLLSFYAHEIGHIDDPYENMTRFILDKITPFFVIIFLFGLSIIKGFIYVWSFLFFLFLTRAFIIRFLNFRREYYSDSYAAKLLSKEIMISALSKFPEISSSIFSTHPSIKKRIKNIEND